MHLLKVISFFLLCGSVVSIEEETDGPVEFTWQLSDGPIENATVVTSDEVETQDPSDGEEKLLTRGVYGIDEHSLNVFHTSDAILDAPSDVLEITEAVNATNATMTADNSTAVNASDAKQKMKVECTPRMLGENEIPTVALANSSTLLEVLKPVTVNKNVTTGDCVVVLFYSNQCVFSARMAPHFNALPRVFPDIAFYAVDVVETGNLYVRYGLVYVPNVMLFHNGKPIARCNETTLNLDVFVKFLNKFTGLEHNDTLNVTSVDMNGPVPSTLTKKLDYVLILAWLFTLSCFSFGFAKSSVCRRLVEFLRNTWYEANAAQHEHEE